MPGRLEFCLVWNSQVAFHAWMTGPIRHYRMELLYWDNLGFVGGVHFAWLGFFFPDRTSGLFGTSRLDRQAGMVLLGGFGLWWRFGRTGYTWLEGMVFTVWPADLLVIGSLESQSAYCQFWNAD
ncbi:hypothetical protein Nepgr_015916 [Nepenthes gracilis]|uniref:Uncharacterized protein n=1 Tax=Nepenthes gracilis TaxID=150966 RepID=A0AAD3SLR1_NEPGR|nr:hypothetical protein Nepgr_015916 [Nepenthes gracilis]